MTWDWRKEFERQHGPLPTAALPVELLDSGTLNPAGGTIPSAQGKAMEPAARTGQPPVAAGSPLEASAAIKPTAIAERRSYVRDDGAIMVEVAPGRFVNRTVLGAGGTP